MPKLPVMTAQGQGAMLRLPAANADALGGQAGRATIGFAQALDRIDQALQAQRDEIDFAQKSARTDMKVADETRALLDDATIDDRDKPRLLEERIRTIRRDEMSDVSQRVAQALMVHEQRILPQTMIHFQTALREQAIKRAGAELSTTLNGMADLAARNPDFAERELQNLTGYSEKARERGAIPKDHIDKSEHDALHRYWDGVARQHPQKIYEILRDINRPGGEYPKYMDPAKFLTYLGTASTVQHALQSGVNADRKAKDDEAQRIKIETKNEFYGMLLRGEEPSPTWYADNQAKLGDAFDEIAKEGMSLNAKGGVGVEGVEMNALYKRVFVNNWTDRAALYKIPGLNTEQRLDIEAKMTKRETELRAARENPEYYANQPVVKDHEKQLRSLMGDENWLVFLRPNDAHIVNQSVVEFRARVEEASKTDKNWQQQVPIIAAEIVQRNAPKLSTGVKEPSEWRGSATESLAELQKEFIGSGRVKSTDPAVLAQNPEFRRRATQIIAYEAFLKRRGQPVEPKKAEPPKKDALVEFFNRLMQSGSQENQ